MNQKPQIPKPTKELASAQDVADLFNAVFLFLEEMKQATSQDIEDVKKTADEALALAETVKKLPGKPGYTPIKGKDYFDGKNAVITEKDKQDIAKSIVVPVVKEKIIEIQKTEVVHELPIITETKTEIRVPSEVTAEAIVDVVNSLSEDSDYQIDISHIRGIKELMDSIKRMIYSQTTYVGVGGAATTTSGGGINLETPTGTVDGTNTVFTVSNEPKYLSIDGVNKFSTANYSYASGTITITDGAPPTVSIRSFY